MTDNRHNLKPEELEALEASVSFSSDLVCEYRDHMGNDDSIIEAMMVSTKGSDALDLKADKGRLNFMMKHRHGSPFEQAALKFYVKAPIMVFREWHRHRIGFCLPGDAKISVGTFPNGKTKKIADVYRDWYEGVPDTMGRNRKLPSCRNLVARTLNLETGMIENARMVDVYQSGVKPIRKLTTKSGRSIRCTDDHRLWTPNGWVKAKNVRIGDCLGRQGKVAVGELKGIPKRLRTGIQEWTTQQKNSVVKPVDSCVMCGSVFSYEDLQVDHKIPVCEDLTLALSLDNLRPVCKPCHRRKTNSEQSSGDRKRPLALGVRWDEVTSNELDGEEMTYDIEMPAPWHNFVADDFVVHNSYNEVSARYKVMKPEFYIPGPDRPLVQQGKHSAAEFVPGSPEQHAQMSSEMREVYQHEWETYVSLIKQGVAKEVARSVLGVGLYTEMITTLNPRSAMAFLSLRQHHSDAMFVSRPQWEINQCANEMEKTVAELFPITYNCFVEQGRVAP